MEKTTEIKPLTRAEKMRVAKEIIKGLLQKNGYKASELIEAAAKEFSNRFGGEETENANDVRGRIGSVLDVMKKDNEVTFENGAYAKMDEEKPKAKRTRKKKTEQVEETQEEKPKAKRTKKKIEPLPTPPLQPIAPTAPTSPETAPEPVKEEKPKAKRTRTKKTEEKAEKVQEETKAVEKEEKENEEKHELMDMSFLLGAGKKAETKVEVKAEEQKEEKTAPTPKPVIAPQVKKAEEKKPVPVPSPAQNKNAKPARAQKPKTADEKLQEAFLSRLHRLGGEYFEYYCVYLLEKYSRMNGRRLESLKITGGDHDGGIDGEIEVTDRLGFKETIYIQAKNWDPSKGDEKLWIVGETLLQQFIGACVCRQAKDKKQHCRGMFITTSRFTPEAKRLLDDTSDKFVGYDGTDLYETAKECGFGIIKRGLEYVLDENLLSSGKAFFNMK